TDTQFRMANGGQERSRASAFLHSDSWGSDPAGFRYIGHALAFIAARCPQFSVASWMIVVWPLTHRPACDRPGQGWKGSPPFPRQMLPAPSARLSWPAY